jgi:gas vesicle protein
MDKENLVLASIVSAISGAAIGLLYAPDKGSKMRKEISKKSDELLKELKRDIEFICNDLNIGVSSTKDEMDAFGEDVKRKGDDVLKKAKKMTSYEEWTKEELYNRAKKMEIENYSTMNKSELIQALDSQ